MANSLRYQDGTKYARLTVSGTDVHRSGRAFVHRVVINDALGAARFRVYDGPTIAGNVVADIDVVGAGLGGYLEYGVVLQGGLTVELTADADVTIIYE